MDLGLSARVAVVTGGASNIGRAISQVLAAERATVAILDRDEDMAMRTAAEITDAGGSAAVYAVDLTDTDATKAACDAVGADLGPVDVLVNNVGWNGKAGFFLELPPERWEQAYRLNMFPTMNATRAVLPSMVERHAGAIVSIASDAGFGEFRMGDYGPMKAGVMAFTRIIAKEYGRYGVRANTVCPGLVIPGRRRSARAACGSRRSVSATSRSPTWSAPRRCVAGRRRSTSPTPSPGWRPSRPGCSPVRWSACPAASTCPAERGDSAGCAAGRLKERGPVRRSRGGGGMVS